MILTLPRNFLNNDGSRRQSLRCFILKNVHNKSLIGGQETLVPLDVGIERNDGVGQLIKNQLAVQLMRHRSLALNDDQAVVGEDGVGWGALCQIDSLDVLE